MVANLPYAITIPGILKMVTIAICAICVLPPTFVGIKRAGYLKGSEKCEGNDCPAIWAPWIAAIIVSIEFLASTVVFLVLLIKPLNAIAKFKLIDIIGHAAAGVLAITAGALTVTYAGDAQNTRVCYCSACKAQRDGKYAPETFMIAGSFMIIEGMIYIATAIIIAIFTKTTDAPPAPAAAPAPAPAKK